MLKLVVLLVFVGLATAADDEFKWDTIPGILLLSG
jgi:hypothetical protein